MLDYAEPLVSAHKRTPLVMKSMSAFGDAKGIAVRRVILRPPTGEGEKRGATETVLAVERLILAPAELFLAPAQLLLALAELFLAPPSTG